MRGSKPLGLIAFWWKSVPEFLRKLIATCDFPVGGGGLLTNYAHQRETTGSSNDSLQ